MARVRAQKTACTSNLRELGVATRLYVNEHGWLQPAQVQLAKLGAPHDSILVDDLALADMNRYKLVVFLNCFHLNDAQRQLIRRKVLNRNRAVLWCYAPGLFNGATASVEAMRYLTGLRLVRAGKPDRVRARIALNEAGAQLYSQTQARPVGVAEAAAGNSDTAALPAIIGHEHVWAQLISVEDPQAIVLGHLEGRSDVALAMKHLKHWTSVSTLNPVLPATFLRGLARQAGVHLYNNRDDTLDASRSYLSVNADGSGERTLRFPKPTYLFDVFSGGHVARRVTSFVHAFQDKKTLLIRYQT